MKRNEEAARNQREIFAHNFNHYLSLRGRNQSDIVDLLGVSSSTVSAWANAQKYPRVDKMQIIADYLGVLISDLREEKPPTSKDEGLMAEQMQAIEKIRKLKNPKSILLASAYLDLLEDQDND